MPVKSALGPDAHDVLIYMKHLTEHHGALARFVIQSTGSSYGGSLDVTLNVSAPFFTSAGQTYANSFSAPFPNCNHKTMEGLLYWLLHKADFQLSKDLWRQSGLALD